jgi:hypothetical protein
MVRGSIHRLPEALQIDGSLTDPPPPQSSECQKAYVKSNQFNEGGSANLRQVDVKGSQGVSVTGAILSIQEIAKI